MRLTYIIYFYNSGHSYWWKQSREAYENIHPENGGLLDGVYKDPLGNRGFKPKISKDRNFRLLKPKLWFATFGAAQHKSGP